MKKGISLIVLLITIIIIIILAGSVILSITQNNPIGDAKQAASDSDKVAIQSQVVLKLSAIMSTKKSEVIIGTSIDNTVANFIPTLALPAKETLATVTSDGSGGITITPGPAKYRCDDAVAVIYDNDKITLPSKIGTWYIDKNGTVTFTQG